MTYTYAIKNNNLLKLDADTSDKHEDSIKISVVVWMHGGRFFGGSRCGYDQQ